MKWVIWLSVLTVVLTIADIFVHISETGSPAKGVTSEFAGISDLRGALATQAVWTAAAGWIVMSQIGIIVLAAVVLRRQNAERGKAKQAQLRARR